MPDSHHQEAFSAASESMQDSQGCGCAVKESPAKQGEPLALNTSEPGVVIDSIQSVSVASLLQVFWKDNPAALYRHLYPDRQGCYLVFQRLLI